MLPTWNNQTNGNHKIHKATFDIVTYLTESRLHVVAVVVLVHELPAVVPEHLPDLGRHVHPLQGGIQ